MASRGINKVILVGNLGRDPEIRYTQSGDPIANITVATSESWKDKNTGENRENTEWHRVVMFRGLAKVAEDWLKKGQQVYIEGRLQTRKWQDKEGQDRYTTEVVANDMQMLGGRSSGGGGGGGGGGGMDEFDQSSRSRPSGGSQSAPQGGGAGGGGQPKGAFDDFDDDIPF